MFHPIAVVDAHPPIHPSIHPFTPLRRPKRRRTMHHHLNPLIPGLLLLALLAGSLVAAAAATEQKCYGVNGVLQSADIQPCTADLPAGSHAACCNLAKNPPDLCVGGGLCYSQDSRTIAELLVAYGCTDPTGDDAACRKYCASEFLILLYCF